MRAPPKPFAFNDSRLTDCWTDFLTILWVVLLWFWTCMPSKFCCAEMVFPQPAKKLGLRTLRDPIAGQLKGWVESSLHLATSPAALSTEFKNGRKNDTLLVQDGARDRQGMR